MLVNTKYFSPAAGAITKAPKESYEYNDWWVEQYKRCENGYQVGDTRITGRHYYYLNFWKIRGYDPTVGYKRIIHPRFLDIDYDFFHEIDLARENDENMLVLKRRQAGFSEKSGSLGSYEFNFVENSQTIITAGEEKYSTNTFKMITRGLNEQAEYEFYKHRDPDSAKYIEARYQTEVDGVKMWQGMFSSVMNIVATDPQALIGYQPSFVYFEEIGKFKSFLEVYDFVKPALYNEGRKTGFALFVGTGGKHEQGLSDTTEAFYNPERYNLRSYPNVYGEGYDPNESSTQDLRRICYFMPASKYHLIDNDGNSLIQESLIDIEKRRDKVRGNATAYLNEITQFPLTPEEALMMPSGNRFNVQVLREQLSLIMRSKKHSEMIQTGNLDWTLDEKGAIAGVKWEPHLNGVFRIVEHPETYSDNDTNVVKELYVAGTDSYDFDESSNEATASLGSCYVYKRFRDADHTSNLFVASVTMRPKTTEEFFEATAKLCMYYGKCKNLVERSKIRILDWYRQMGFLYLLKHRPTVAYASMPHSKAKYPYGIDPSTKQYWITALADYIEKNSDQIYDPQLIERLIRYREDPKYNCDRTIASSLCIVHDNDNFAKRVKQEEPNKFKWLGYKTNGSGIARTIMNFVHHLYYIRNHAITRTNNSG